MYFSVKTNAAKVPEPRVRKRPLEKVKVAFSLLSVRALKITFQYNIPPIIGKYGFRNPFGHWKVVFP